MEWRSEGQLRAWKPHLGVIGHLPDISLDVFPVRAGVEVFAGVLFLFGDPAGGLFRVLFEPVVRIGDVYGALGLAFVDIDVVGTARLGVAVRDPGVGGHRCQGEPTERRDEGGWAREFAREASPGVSE
jgi:hypothetical protein